MPVLPVISNCSLAMHVVSHFSFFSIFHSFLSVYTFSCDIQLKGEAIAVLKLLRT